MDKPKRETRLTPEEQELKERLMRSGTPVMRGGSGKMPGDFWELSRTREGRRMLTKRLARSGKVVTRGTGKVSEEFWKLPKPKISDGSLLEALLRDREEGR